jgi:predicted Rossmann-fold nucleotide-binding protein
MQVCVYCASSAKIHHDYFEATDLLAKELVNHGFSVVFGGGSSGLMGQLADSVLDAGGKIKGIMPQFMNEVEWAIAEFPISFIHKQCMSEKQSFWKERMP